MEAIVFTEENTGIPKKRLLSGKNGNEVIVFHILDPQEIRFNFGSLQSNNFCRSFCTL